MKKRTSIFSKLLVAALLLCSQNNSVFAQKFEWSGNDSIGDQKLLWTPDLNVINYAVSYSSDSIWFQIDFSREVESYEWSLEVALDTDRNPNNGGNWQGNHPFRYDYKYVLFHNPGFFPIFHDNIFNAIGALVDTNSKVQFIDTNRILMGFRLSKVSDKNTDINYVVGAGDILGEIQDEAPNSGSYHIEMAHLSFDNQIKKSEDVYFYQGDGGALRLTNAPLHSKMNNVNLHSISGQKLGFSNSRNEDFTELQLNEHSPGIYVISFELDEKLRRQKLFLR